MLYKHHGAPEIEYIRVRAQRMKTVSSHLNLTKTGQIIAFFLESSH